MYVCVCVCVRVAVVSFEANSLCPILKFFCNSPPVVRFWLSFTSLVKICKWENIKDENDWNAKGFMDQFSVPWQNLSIYLCTIKSVQLFYWPYKARKKIIWINFITLYDLSETGENFNHLGYCSYGWVSTKYTKL